jgi:hypothetical protein
MDAPAGEQAGVTYIKAAGGARPWPARYAVAVQQTDEQYLPRLVDAWERSSARLKQDLSDEEWADVSASYVAHLKWYFGEPELADARRDRFARLMSWVLGVYSACGLVFAGAQLWFAYKLRDLASLNTTFSQEAGKLSLQTSVVGLLAMLVGVGLIWLYYKHIYATLAEPPILLRLPDTDGQQPDKADTAAPPAAGGQEAPAADSAPAADKPAGDAQPGEVTQPGG